MTKKSRKSIPSETNEEVEAEAKESVESDVKETLDSGDLLKVKRKALDLGVPHTGTVAEVSEKIDRAVKGDPTQKVAVGTADNAGTEDISKLPEQEPKNKVLAPTEADVNILKDVRAQHLMRNINEFTKGRVSITFDTVNYGLEFRGGPRQAEWISLTADDSLILNTAKKFVSRTTIGKNKQVSVQG